MTSRTTVTHKVCLPSAILPCVQRWVQIDIINYRQMDRYWMNGIQKLSFANDAELMKCGFLSKKFYFLKKNAKNVRTYLIGFSVLHFAKENWILCKSAELVKLGISIYFWLGNPSKKSRLAFFFLF